MGRLLARPLRGLQVPTLGGRYGLAHDALLCHLDPNLGGLPPEATDRLVEAGQTS